MWNIKLNPEEELHTLSEDEQKAIRGGAGQCIYDNRIYSQGSIVKMADGQLYKCQSDGTWKLHDPAQV